MPRGTYFILPPPSYALHNQQELNIIFYNMQISFIQSQL